MHLSVALLGCYPADWVFSLPCIACGLEPFPPCSGGTESSGVFRKQHQFPWGELPRCECRVAVVKVASTIR